MAPGEEAAAEGAAAEEVRRAERERCRAISEQDWPALERVLADDLTHTHMQGRVDDKPALLENLRRRPRTVRRGELTVRVYGEVAVINGRQYLDMGDGETENEAIQVWQRNEDGWRQVAFQASPVGPTS
jgi:ketosteroid isomerase-like protein